MVPTADACGPVPMIAVVNSRPGRYSSTSTGCPWAFNSASQTARSSSGVPIREAGVMPFPVPSPMGFAKSG